MLFRFLSLFIVCTLCLTACKSKKKTIDSQKNSNKERVVASEAHDEKTEEESSIFKVPPANASFEQVVDIYIENYSNIAMAEMEEYGIPASITLAQGILESGAGRADLARRSNNHFGIKCHTGWTGERVYHDDDEAQECFRKYANPENSFRDHSIFLTGRSRYKDLFKLKKKDYKGWAKGLRRAGYATDPKYPTKLIRIIEKYHLDNYDKMVLGGKRNKSNIGSKDKKYRVRKGDTLYSIAERFNITVDLLKSYNNLKSNHIGVGDVLDLPPSKNR